MLDVQNNKWINIAKSIAVFILVAGSAVKANLSWDKWGITGILVIAVSALLLIHGIESEVCNPAPRYINNLFIKYMVPYFYTSAAIIILDCLKTVFIDNNSYFNAMTYRIADGLRRCMYASGWTDLVNGIHEDYSISVTWILPALFFGNIIFQAIMNLIKNEKLAGVVMGCFAFLGYFTSKLCIIPFAIQAAAIASFMIWVGYFICRNNYLDRVSWKHFASAILLAGLSWYFGYSEFGSEMAGCKDLAVCFVLGMSASLIIMMISRKIFMIKSLDFAGRKMITVLCVLGAADNTLFPVINGIFNDNFGGKKRAAICVLVSLAFIFAISLLIEAVTRFYRPLHMSFVQKSSVRDKWKRDSSIAAARGIFTILMLIGHYKIDLSMTYLIYSCHMAAFVIFSGYFYRADRSFAKTVLRMFKTFLLPYLLYVAGIFLINLKSVTWEYAVNTIVQHIAGISFSEKLLTEMVSVGPVYFILMLFVIRILYMIVDRIAKSELAKNISVFALSFLGILLGYLGWWLPWSLDVALYCLAFYRIGLLLNKYGILEKLKNNMIFVPLLCVIWAFEISRGGMELAFRNYGSYIIVLVGAASGTIIIYMLSCFITKNLPIIKCILRKIGDWSIYVIIIHTLTRPFADSFTERFFLPETIYYHIISITLQIAGGLLLKYVIEMLKKIIHCASAKSCRQ